MKRTKLRRCETVVTQGSMATINGIGFDTCNGVAVDLFCAGSGGKVGPFFLNPGDSGLSSSAINVQASNTPYIAFTAQFGKRWRLHLALSCEKLRRPWYRVGRPRRPLYLAVLEIEVSVRYMSMDPEQIKAKIAKVFWYHAFEILPGAVTPGVSPFDAAGFLNSFGIPASAR